MSIDAVALPVMAKRSVYLVRNSLSLRELEHTPNPESKVTTPMLNKNSIMPNCHAVRIKAPAKINLSLVVFGMRDDGYHQIHSVVAAVSLYDNLTASRTDKPGLQLYCDGLDSPKGPENLVCQAAVKLAKYVNVKPNANIFLNKKIPAGAGLGGASSDAAACLVALNQLWKLDLQQEELEKIAATIGSDVPFFLSGPVAVCSGRGEIVQTLPYKCNKHLLLIMPKIHVETKKVYENYIYDQNKSNSHIERVKYFLRHGDLDGLTAQAINSLADTAIELFGPLKEIKERLQNIGLGSVGMCGSGSTLFLSAESEQQIARWAWKIKEQNISNLNVAAVHFQEQPEYCLEVQREDI